MGCKIGIKYLNVTMADYGFCVIQMALVRRFMYESSILSLDRQDYLRNSDTGEAAMVEAKREAEALDNLIAENEGENEKVAARRKERLRRDAEERKRQIE